MIIAQGQIPGQAPASGFTTDTWAITWPLDQPTPVAASLVSAQATPTEVRLRWYAATSPIGPVTLERSVAHEPWARLGEIEADGTGTLSFTDRSVTPGTRYGYRLRLGESGGAAPATEAWVDVPAAALLSLRGAWPNPSGGNPSMVFSLPGTAPATLELFDVTGRGRWVREVGSYGPGTHVLPLSGLDLPPGVYLARLKQSGETRSARLIVTR
jgi:hypothetical protein